jgi:guanylate kinase
MTSSSRVPPGDRRVAPADRRVSPAAGAASVTNANSGAGSLFVIVAPSGAGKTSLVRALLNQRPNIELSVSTTTRLPRPGESDARDYFFVDRDEFERRRDAGDFLEWAEVHGNMYGTSRGWIEQRIAAGADILLEIDWKGAEQVQRLYPDAIGIFIAPPSLEELRRRLVLRGQDSVEVIERRLAGAESELRKADRFEYVIINQEFASALAHLLCIVDAAAMRFAKQRARYPELFRRYGHG